MVPPDMSWQKGWPHSTSLLVMIIEMLVYGRTYDASLRAGIKHQKTMTELLDNAQPLKEAIEDTRKARSTSKRRSWMRPRLHRSPPLFRKRMLQQTMSSRSTQPSPTCLHL